MVAGAKTSLAIAALSVAAGACASLQGPPEDVPPEAPHARVFRMLSPALRDGMLPPPQVFEARGFLERLVCPLGEQPGWRRTRRTGLVEQYELDCPGDARRDVVLDTAREAPPAPEGLRLLDAASHAPYRRALAAMEKGEFEAALASIDEAIALAPLEPLYRRDRIYVLYSLGRTPEALFEADDVIEVAPSPVAFKYRALVARELNLRREFMASIEGILSTARREHPLFAEAVCAKGMALAGEGDDAEADTWMREGCSLEHKPCCDAVQAREAARLEARRALDAARAIPVQLPNGATPPAAPQQRPPKGDDAPADRPDGSGDRTAQQ